MIGLCFSMNILYILQYYTLYILSQTKQNSENACEKEAGFDRRFILKMFLYCRMFFRFYLPLFILLPDRLISADQYIYITVTGNRDTERQTHMHTIILCRLHTRNK